MLYLKPLLLKEIPNQWMPHPSLSFVTGLFLKSNSAANMISSIRIKTKELTQEFTKGYHENLLEVVVVKLKSVLADFEGSQPRIEHKENCL